MIVVAPLALFGYWGHRPQWFFAGLAVPIGSGAAWWWWAFLPVDLPLTIVVTSLSTGLGSALAAITFTLVRPATRAALPPGNHAL